MSNSGKQLNNVKSQEGDEIEENVGMSAPPRGQQILSQENLDEEILEEEIKTGDQAPPVGEGPIQDEIGS